MEVQEAPIGSKSPRIDEETAEVDLEAGVGPSTSGVGSPSGAGTGGMSLPPSAQPTSQPTSAPVSAAPTPAAAAPTPAAAASASSAKPASKTPGAATPASGKAPSKTPASGKAPSKSPHSAGGSLVLTPAKSVEPDLAAETGSPTKTPGMKSKTPGSKGILSKTPHSTTQSKQPTPTVQFSPTKSSKQSRAESAEEMIARSQASQRSTVLVTPAKSRTSQAKIQQRAEDDRGSDRSISPSQRFTPNRGLTEAEIF